MFLKKSKSTVLTLTGKTALKGSDAKRLRADLHELLPTSSEAQLHAVWPASDAIVTAKTFSPVTDDKVTVYLTKSTSAPVAFILHGAKPELLVPSLYLVHAAQQGIN